jgi:hypothetical protein
MNFWIRKFLWNLLSRPFIRAVSWDDAERKYFDSFCKSSCGVKLLEFLRQYVASQTFNAVCVNNASANAEARGAQRVLALLYRLRSLPLEEASEYQDEDVEPLPSQKKGAPIDGRRWGLSGGNSAIGTMK